MWRQLPVLALAAASTGCLATKGDVRLLQDELRAIRAANAQTDSARRQQVAALSGDLARTADSLRAMSARAAKAQADAATELYQISQGLITIQELTGQSQRLVQQMRTQLEQRQTETAVPDSTGAPAAPGPLQLYTIGTQQYQQNSFRTARTAFEDLLRLYPESDVAPDAQFYLGEIFAQERRQSQADSVYTLVTTKYRSSPRAATSLYRLAQSHRAAGRPAMARSTLERLLREFPRSDEAGLARELLRELR